MNTNIQLTPHFNLRELLHDGSAEGVTPDIVENLRTLANALEKVRLLCGANPIHITSGFRTKKHNQEVGGAVNSQHLYGKAADIVINSVTPKQVQHMLKDWNGGLGSYTTWTHVDIGPKRRWDGP